MNIQLLHIYDKKNIWLNTATAEFSKKISHLNKFELKSLKPVSGSRENAELKKRQDTELLERHLSSDDLVLLCDETGESLGSVTFSKKLESWKVSGKKRIVFVVGGPYGVSKEFQQRADYKISLSSFVLNHHVALLVLLEQIYRGLGLEKNLPYHNK